jgi:hypothetical protein
VTVEAGATTVVPLRTPKQADVLLVASRDPRAPSELQCQASISLGGQNQNPSVRMDGWERFVAVWYELPPGPATLNFSCNGKKIAGKPLSLIAGTIITIRQDIDD